MKPVEITSKAPLQSLEVFRGCWHTIVPPVAGISEVEQAAIQMNSSFYDYTRSCIRGKFPKPCLNCWKCFRKSMADNRLKNTKVSDRKCKSG